MKKFLILGLAFAVLNADVSHAAVAHRRVRRPVVDRPAGLLVVAYGRYRRSGRYASGGRVEGQTLISLGPSHLYLIDMARRRRRRLTSGKYNDFEPLWSPDGKSISFFREVEDRFVLCCLDVRTGHVRRLGDLPAGYSFDDGPVAWSPDGAHVIVGDAKAVYLYSLSGSAQHFEFANGYVPSPSGQSTAVIHAVNGEFEDITSSVGALGLDLKGSVYGATWVSDDTLLTVNLDNDSRQARFQFWSARGEDPTEVMVPIPQGSTLDDFDPDPFYGGMNLHPIDRDRVIVETVRQMSDGVHMWISLVDLRARTWTFLREGRFLGLSPDKRFVAYAPSDWVGPYKRGGERVGRVSILRLSDGKVFRLTGPLTDVEGGDWR